MHVVHWNLLFLQKDDGSFGSVKMVRFDNNLISGLFLWESFIDSIRRDVYEWFFLLLLFNFPLKWLYFLSVSPFLPDILFFFLVCFNLIDN